MWLRLICTGIISQEDDWTGWEANPCWAPRCTRPNPLPARQPSIYSGHQQVYWIQTSMSRTVMPAPSFAQWQLFFLTAGSSRLPSKLLSSFLAALPCSHTHTHITTILQEDNSFMPLLLGSAKLCGSPADRTTNSCLCGRSGIVGYQPAFKSKALESTFGVQRKHQQLAGFWGERVVF